MRRRYKVHSAIRKAAQVCGFSREEGEAQSPSKLKAERLKERQQEEVEVRNMAEGFGRIAEIEQAKK